MSDTIKDKFIVFGAPEILEDEVQEVTDSMRSGWLGTGPKVARFEEAFSKYKGYTKGQAAAVNSCTAALQLSLIAAGIGPGDEVITTSLTFCATVNAIIHAGATPVIVDVDPGSMNIDVERVKEAITDNTRAILPVHFAGRACDMNGLLELVNAYGLTLIEDCAHAIETEYKGKKAGTLGDFGCFSFYVTKNVVTGEGGMVLARSKEDIDRVKVLSLHGMSKDAWNRFGDSGYKHYLVHEAGYKFNMMDIQASIGIHQLKRVDRSWRRRQEIWNRYQQAFKDLDITCPMDVGPDERHGYHLYTVLIDEEKAGIQRDEFLDRMTDKGIGVGVHYLSIAEHPYYQKTFGWRPEDFPNAQRIGRQTVSLPLSPKLSDEDVERVISSVIEILKG